MKKGNKLTSVWRGLTAVSASLLALSTLGYGIADTWRSNVDAAFGTQSFITNTDDVKYTSTYKTGDEMMNAAKAFAVREGAEGTVIMKNENGVLPLKKGTVALFGGAAYRPYMSAAGNSDQVKLEKALTDAGFTIDSTMKSIYEQLLTHEEYVPNTRAGDYTDFPIREANADKFTTDGGAATTWREQVQADTAIVVFSRPGGEGTTYKPGSAQDAFGKPTGKNPLALSDDELSVVKAAKEACDKVVVLLNTSCTIEIGALKSGEYAVDGIAYIGIPNDYQFTGIVQALSGEVNPTGALADTYATDSTSSPAMMNFGGGYYSDFETVSDFDDTRWPGVEINNETVGSFGGKASYSGGFYIVEAEGIYTGYNYYESRYYDCIVNPSSNASSAKGSTQDSSAWSYDKEVSYTFGYGLSYLPYEQKLTGVTVEDRVGGNVTATIEITNNGDKSGMFLAQLYVQTPYTAYDKANKVEKSAIQFLNSGKVEVGAHETEMVTVTIPTKYLASYDYTTAKTYILDGGTYYFATGNGAHDALNNILAAQNHTKGLTDVNGEATTGNKECVATWKNGDESATDTSTFAVSDSGGKITNVADNADLNYYLPGTVTYLSRTDWDATYPVNYNTFKNGGGVTLADSPKKDEWLKELRNQQHVLATDNPVENVDGIPSVTFQDIGYEQQINIEDEFWDQLVNAISLDQAVGAVAHGGSQSDTLDNIENPVVKQNDGPTGFNGKALSTNNGEPGSDPYYVDPESEAGKFKANVNSQTLLGSSFNPELALEWGRILGNTGLWIKNYQIWGGGLNYHRSPYNGRNTEYLSEDPMLTNVLGTELIKGTNEFGIINGPKHIGFNDQEYDRSGICVYMNELKFRETDLRGFQGAVEEGGALGLMVAFNRIGAINASHHVGMLKNLVRGEWGFKGLISTDMMNNKYYFNPEGCIMATVTQMADFAGDNSTLGGAGGTDATWTYLSVDNVKNDAELVDAARECMKYQLYAFANSAVLNITTTPVVPSWEKALRGVIGTTIVLSAGFATLWAVSLVLGKKKEEE